jgi:hypothetical protein
MGKTLRNARKHSCAASRMESPMREARKIEISWISEKPVARIPIFS